MNLAQGNTGSLRPLVIVTYSWKLACEQGQILALKDARVSAVRQTAVKNPLIHREKLLRAPSATGGKGRQTPRP